MTLFLYGTLLHGPLFDAVAGPGDGYALHRAATLPGYRVEGVAGQGLPMLVADPGSTVEGALWSGLTPAQRERLDTYEVPFGYAMRQVVVKTALVDGTMQDVPAMAYFPPQSQHGSGQRWSLDAWCAQEGDVAVLAAQEIAGHAPPLSGAALVAQWKMIAARAHAVRRAGQADAPASLRHAAAPGDHVHVPARPLAGGFFKLAAMEMAHRRFDGSRATGLIREVLVGADAALVLPYDAARDRVLLVEQYRSGPARRGDPNPWCLEPVAGMVDAGETPEQAALRETAEEAGLTLATDQLERMFAFYASPGSSTDHFYCYLARADLPDDHARFGGLAEEAEDLALHVLPFDAALALIDTGEINAGPMIAMLLWLARARARLRP